MPLHSRTILGRLRKLGQHLSAEYPKLNYGGCALVAYSAAECLQELGVRCDIVAGSGGCDDPAVPAVPAKIREYVPDCWDVGAWDKWGLARDHLAVRFRLGWRTRVWDRDGFWTAQAFGEGGAFYAAGKLGSGLTAHEAKSMYWAREDYWNPVWNRGYSMAVERAVREHLLC